MQDVQEGQTMKVNNSTNNNNKNIEHVKRAIKAEKAEKEKSSSKSEESQNANQTVQSTNVDLSSEAKSAAKARQVAMEPAQVNDEKVERIKAMVSSGKYQPDYGKVADKVVNEQLLQELL